MSKLMQYHWPGNIRELQNLIEKTVILGDESIIDRKKDGTDNLILLENKELISEAMLNMDYKLAKETILESFEREYFTALLKRSNGNISEAARISGMHRKNLFVKLRNLGLK